MKKLIIISTILGLMALSIVTAIQVDFFYSDTCQYCQRIKPFVIEMAEKYDIKFYETSNEENYNLYKSYGFTGVPAFVINTGDERQITFTGANQPKLNCELQEMSTKDCVTYSADNCIGESWFVE